MGWAWLGDTMSKVWGFVTSMFSSLWSGLLALLGLLLLLGLIKVAIGVCTKATKGLGSGPWPSQEDEVVKKKEVISGKT